MVTAELPVRVNAPLTETVPARVTVPPEKATEPSPLTVPICVPFPETTMLPWSVRLAIWVDAPAIAQVPKTVAELKLDPAAVVWKTFPASTIRLPVRSATPVQVRIDPAV